jgi:hypothetical protein
MTIIRVQTVTVITYTQSARQAHVVLQGAQKWGGEIERALVFAKKERSTFNVQP